MTESISSSGSPPRVNGLLLFMMASMIFVLHLLMLSPVCVDTVFRSSVFFPVYGNDFVIGEPHCLQSQNPLDTISPIFWGPPHCLTLHHERVCQLSCMNDLASQPVVRALYQRNKLLWYSVSSRSFQRVLMVI